MSAFASGAGRLGVGIVYAESLEPLLTSGADAPTVLEVEPQTLWRVTHVAGDTHYRVPPDAYDRLEAFPQPKLIHGVGQPFADSHLDPVAHIPLLRQTVEWLDPAWISEHLSFMRAKTDRGIEQAGFMLPPLQADSTVRVAAANIDAYRKALGRPVAFETGTNYLRDRYGPLSDGDFFSQVSHTADCGILLDLHNIWCNELNGRDSVEDVLDAIPLDSVWELHLAGGDTLDGTHLDAHNGVVAPELLDRAAETIPRLVNLRAIIYEINPDAVDTVGLDALHTQMRVLHDLWDLVPPIAPAPLAIPSIRATATSSDLEQVDDWESTLLDAIVHVQASMTPQHNDVRSDPGSAIYHRLVEDARFGAITRVLRYTITLLLLHLGRGATITLLRHYCDDTPQHNFAGIEAHMFADFLLRRLTDNPSGELAATPFLVEVLAFESQTVNSALSGRRTAASVTMSVPPDRLFSALDQGRIPTELPRVRTEIR